MKNCKLTQYKKATNADLEVYGELLYEIPASAAGNDVPFAIGCIQDAVISIEGNLELWDNSKTTNLGSSYVNPDPAPNSASVKVVVNGAGKVRITNKYNCKQGNYQLRLYPTKFGFNTKSISYWWKGKTLLVENFAPKSSDNIVEIDGELKELERANAPLTRINVAYSTMDGKMDDMAFYKDTLTTLELYSSHIKGNIENLGECTLLTTISKYNSNPAYAATGTIEGFVARQRTAGRTIASNISVDLRGNNCTFNGAAITAFSENNLSWTASTITFNGVTITA